MLNNSRNVVAAELFDYFGHPRYYDVPKYDELDYDYEYNKNEDDDLSLVFDILV